jgi:hypothetical protein
MPSSGKEIGDTSNLDFFAEQHINENLVYLEYRVIVEMISPAVPDNQQTLIRQMLHNN